MPDRPCPSESLHGLSYPGPLTGIPFEIINYVISVFGFAVTLFIDKIRHVQ